MFKINIDNKMYERKEPISLVDLAAELNLEVYCAKVNNRLRELSYKVTKNCVVEFLDLTSIDSINVYQTTLRYIAVMAIKRLYKNAKVVINFSVSRSLFFKIEGLDSKLDRTKLALIEAEMKRIVDADIPIVRRTVSKAEALKTYSDQGYEDKSALLAYRPDSDVHFYECDGYLNYMFGYMTPSTGFIKYFSTKLYSPGFILQYPRAEVGGKIPKFEDAPTFSKALKESNKWGSLISGSYISEMNKKIENLEEVEFINLCETKHNDQLAELGLKIKAEIENIRLIAIAGPSSSGKTTFTNRLKVELMARGIMPVMISIDDYYFGKEFAPKDEFGEPDLEHIHALDVELFNRDMHSLIEGEEVTLPHFNFETGTREKGKTVKVPESSPIMIEGIHALNDLLTSSIPKHQKYKIYISPQSQLHIDDHNPISITDIRLLRRMVRDYKFRNSPATMTLSMWSSVRRGEFKWIYPTQEGVDYVYNSELTYELCVLKKYALPLLSDIENDSPYFIQANRLIKFLKYFKTIDEQWIPCNSILREFIGGSSFYRR